MEKKQEPDMDIIKTPQEIQTSIQDLLEIYEAGGLPRPEQHEVSPDLEIGSRENYIYFTFPCALNYQRNSPAMWASALATYQDEETRFVFEPRKVAESSFEDLQGAMRKHKLALKTNKDPDAWQRLAITFAENYDADPRKLVAEAGNSIARLIEIVQKEKKPDFPYIGGPKLSNYWIFILSRFTDVEFTDPYELSIIPDVHVIKASKALGLVGEEAKAKDVDLVWRPVLKQMGIHPAKMHSALWLWSRSGFAVGVEGVEIDREPRQPRLFGDES